MGANHGAFAALNAHLRMPCGNFQSQVALLRFRCPGGERAVTGKSADRKFIAATGIDCAENVVLKFGRSGEGGGDLSPAADGLWNLHLEQMSDGFIDSAHVLLNHVFALAAVGMADRFTDLLA